jgi:hypothetical protein
LVAAREAPQILPFPVSSGKARFLEFSTINLNTAIGSDFRHLYVDVFWFGVLAGSAMAIYASRIGASGLQVGFLSGSAFFYMAMLLISLRLSRLSDRFGHRNILVHSGRVYCLYLDYVYS